MSLHKTLLYQLKSLKLSIFKLPVDKKKWQKFIKKINKYYVDTAHKHGKQLRHQALHDVLTSLPNKTLLYDKLKCAIELADREKHMLGVLFFDLDDFRLINEDLDYKFGDVLLQLISKRIVSCIRKEDVLSRIGGDEFVVVFQQLKLKSNIAIIANKILQKIQEPLILAGKTISVKSSIGISVYPKNGKRAIELLSNAELAMYQAKKNGGGQFRFYTKNINKKRLLKLEKEAELRLAIDNKEFFMCYQPQIDLTTKKLISVEALIRWNHPKLGLVYPLDFIHYAEDSGLIVAIGEWVLRTACLQNKHWQLSGYKPICMAVNVANKQIRQANFVKMVEEVLQETNLEPKYLEIELTENIVINSFEIVEIVNHLRSLGVKFAIDDFGTGNTSLNYLRQIAIDHLKIDQSFIKNVNTDHNSNVIMKTMIAMANNLNIDVIAEGVETIKHVEFLQQHGCGYAQGYYFSKPILALELEKWLEKL